MELPTYNYQKYILMTRTSFVDRCWSFCPFPFSVLLFTVSLLVSSKFSLSLWPFSFGHCIVCLSSDYLFSISMLFHSSIALSVFLLITTLLSPCFFIRPLNCLSFSFVHCIFCLSSYYLFSISILFHSAIELSVVFIRPLYCLSFFWLPL